MPVLTLYITALIAGLILTPVVSKLAMALNVFDKPGLRKVHQSATPRIGGMAVAASALVAMVLGVTMGNPLTLVLAHPTGKMLILALSAASVFIVGLIDDIWGVKAWLKLLVQSAAALAVCSVGLRLETIGLPGLFEIQLGFWSWPLTCFWIVSISNALNLIDGLDGLAGGISLMACATMAILAWHLSLPVSYMGLVTMMGALCGFLVFNVHPAKVFLGDCGALMLGFLLAETSLEASAHGGALLGMGMLVMVMGVPVLDVCSSVWRRLLQRRAISAPDRQHIHHRLLDAGIGHPQTVLLIHMATAMLALLGLTLIRADNWARIGIITSGLSLLFVMFRRTCMGSVQDVLTNLTNNFHLFLKQRSLRRVFEDGQIQLRSATEFYPWWNGVCDVARAMKVARMGMTIESRHGEHRSLVWGNNQVDPQDDCLQLVVPVRHRRPGPMLMMRVEIPTGLGLELAGKTAAAITRLLEQNSIAHLPEPKASRSNGEDRAQNRAA